MNKKIKNKLYYRNEKLNKQSKNFIRFSLKKGKKEVAEKNMKKMLFYLTNKTKKNSNNIIKSGIKKSKTPFNYKTKAFGSKKVYSIDVLKESYSLYLAHSWIIKNASNRNNKNFYKNLGDEFLSIAEGTSSIYSQKAEIYKTIKANIFIK